MTKLLTTKAYVERLLEIQNFIYEQTESIELVQKFHDEHDRVKEFIKQNPTTPAPHPSTGDQSWPFSNGRYRVFMKTVIKEEQTIVYLLDLIDNRMLNHRVYPDNSIPTYNIEE
ncbi:MAG: hypothetical protein CME64_03730 [Halobacteriovoraceae bacterium]|nr:hypothetical protein [Halobacteriovoraceae bacterium]|tara:strand:- start:26846 stop:27187 length:342 start_codon:yes stop_codon:yes gene_type:complete